MSESVQKKGPRSKTKAVKAVAELTPSITHRLTPENLREAVILSEVIGKPVCMRGCLHRRG